MRTCQYNNSNKHWSLSEYNNNNAWYYNGNNGRFNNNNKYNSNECRPVLELYYDDSHLEDYPIPYSDFLGYYKICRRHKRNKPSQLLFEIDLVDNLIKLCHEANFGEYETSRSIVFIITQPKPREVIAADFRDRIIQTIIVQKLQPHLEAYMHPDSYSCRVGKGGLKAALMFKEYLREVSENYTKDCWVYSLDFHSFFMSIDSHLWTQRLLDFADEHYEEADWQVLFKLIPKVYLSLPQLNCVKKSPPWMWSLIDPSKSLLHKTDRIGLPIGNVTSQNMANFGTTPYLRRMEKVADKFVHYTDDNKGIVRDKKRFLKSLNQIKKDCWEQDHLIIHPKKFDIQHYSKGTRIGAYKIRFDRILPNDRIAHNFKYKITKAIESAERDEKYIYKHKEDFMATINSYLGILKHCNSYRLKKEYIEKLKHSRWNIVFKFAPDYHKVTIRKEYTQVEWQKRANKAKRKAFLELAQQLKTE